MLNYFDIRTGIIAKISTILMNNKVPYADYKKITDLIWDFARTKEHELYNDLIAEYKMKLEVREDMYYKSEKEADSIVNETTLGV